MKSLMQFTGALLMCLAVGFVGCKSNMTDEMREQESVMSSETSDWQRDIANWRGQHEEMLSWYGNRMATKDSVTARESIGELNEHAANLSTFQTGLEEHQTAVTNEHQLPESGRVTAHAGLWAEHQRLKASHASLGLSHESLMKKYEEAKGRGV